MKPSSLVQDSWQGSLVSSLLAERERERERDRSFSEGGVPPPWPRTLRPLVSEQDISRQRIRSEKLADDKGAFLSAPVPFIPGDSNRLRYFRRLAAESPEWDRFRTSPTTRARRLGTDDVSARIFWRRLPPGDYIRWSSKNGHPRCPRLSPGGSLSLGKMWNLNY